MRRLNGLYLKVFKMLSEVFRVAKPFLRNKPHTLVAAGMSQARVLLCVLMANAFE